ncbi:ribonuclease Y [Longispora fulva]|uniref:Ribonuclease Y n=1 Tax=Longispora fulva TaxID=619741 RepID=A0A8J7GHH6_9ACTN|nr:ribonuclease Y [Longispora fulva]MBG6138086.1 ribonuclease Y [Longispora fulva]GIG60339.1 ribonuclease Y [Longispora fulva]
MTTVGVVVGAVAALALIVVVGLMLVARMVRNLAPGAARGSHAGADVEAEQARAVLEAETTEARAAARRLVEAAKVEANEVATRLRSRAEEEAARVAADAERAAERARLDAERVAERARQESETAVEKARRESESVVEKARLEAERMVAQAQALAEQAAGDVAARARREAEQAVEGRTTQLNERLADVEQRLNRLDERERRLGEEAERLAARDRRIAVAEADLEARESEVGAQEVALAEADEERRRELSRIAGLTAEAAKTELVGVIEVQAKREAAVLIRDIESDARNTAEQRARHIVVEAIQRVASEQTAESVVSVLHLPSDEMKGRIIGREGRNIRAFESVTGVNLIIDDTPEAVLLSCFDPVRREIGRVTLEKLVLDGRIHPHRIEEVHDLARYEVEKLCQRAAEDALVEVGITNIHPELVELLGRLRYRTSYGQNVLKHLVETAHIAGLMAAELGLRPELIKRGAFLHDIGKALTHEVEGSHALIGADLARRFGESEEVVHAIEAHHNEVQPQTIEAVLTQASDSCSGGRPGARRESLEVYVKRLERIEEIASSQLGVERVFAMQAGREIRVMVRPDDVDDIGAAVLARDVAKQIEDELTYPGQIRVTVVRESRVSEIAR